MARACDDLADDLEAGHLPIPRRFAEEPALHPALSEEAPSILEQKEDIEDELHTSLPTHAGDYDVTPRNPERGDRR
ncbi:hypothetical protein GCM10022419_081210 [Nonomuraea rosea]|uniref:DUF2795 domain-containing protein n=1 Tax=Nonomuraea rosea TaxID=638574 RepID=A0ABP6YP54_9ACTN